MKISYPLIGLSPMDGITDVAFRIMVQKYSPSVNIFFSEFINVQALIVRPDLYIKKLRFIDSKSLNFAQVFGNVDQIEYFSMATSLIKQMGFDGIDLNIGCPDKNIVKSGGGSSLIGDKVKVKSIINSIKTPIVISNNFKYNKYIDEYRNDGFFSEKKNEFYYSIKTRIGINNTMEESWWKFIDNLHLDFITIHGRNAKQMYSGNANWNIINRVKNICNTPIIGNGDIKSSEQLINKLRITPKGCLIGRGFLGKPYLLNSHFNNFTNLESIFNLIKEHLNLYQNYISKDYIEPFKKHICFYLSSVENSKSLKLQFMKTKSVDEIENILAYKS